MFVIHHLKQSGAGCTFLQSELQLVGTCLVPLSWLGKCVAQINSEIRNQNKPVAHFLEPEFASYQNCQVSRTIQLIAIKSEFAQGMNVSNQRVSTQHKGRVREEGYFFLVMNTGSSKNLLYKSISNMILCCLNWGFSHSRFFYFEITL